MKKLLKTYSLNSDMDYYEMIVESFLNGQMSQAKAQFCAMPKSNRIDMVKAMTIGNWSCGLGDHKIASLIELI